MNKDNYYSIYLWSFLNTAQHNTELSQSIYLLV